MDDSGMNSDERVALTTPDVVVKSVLFEATLTTRRIILTDRKDNLIPEKEVPLESIRRVETGENAIRDPVLTLWIDAGGETRQMVITFSQRKGAGRKRERDEWAARLREFTGSFAQRTIQKAVPSFAKEPRKRIIEHSSYREEPPVSAPYAESSNREEAPLPYGSFCSRCGNRIMQGSLFCNRCGTKIVTPGQASMPREPARGAPEVPDRYGAAETMADEPARQPLRMPEPEYSTGRVGPHHREKRGFLSWLFRGKNQKQHAAQEYPAQPSHPAPRSAPRSRPPRKPISGSTKKILVTIGIIAVAIVVLAVVGFAAMNFISGLPSGAEGSSGTPASGTVTTTPAAGATLAYNVVATVTIAHTQTPVSVPSEGVSLRVSYLGAWDGTYTVDGVTEPLKRSGEYVMALENATGTVDATFTKLDTSSHELVVEIYKNGALLKSGSTTDPKGKVSISAAT